MTQTAIPRISIENIHDPNEIITGQSQETRIYYRPAKDMDGNEIWIPTTPLPADPWHMNHYAKKGFKLFPPGKEMGEENIAEAVNIKAADRAISCPMDGCSFIAKTYIGLARHTNRVHNTK